MNITELARILRISPQELRDLLPELGFSIGQKAIKVDNNTAKKIIKNWSVLRREWEQKKMAETIKKQDNERVNSITENANSEVSAVNIQIGDLQAELDSLTSNEEE